MHFSSNAAKLRLTIEPEQQSQALIYGFALGFQPSCTKCVPHEFVVDNDVRPHECVSKYTIIHIPTVAQAGERATLRTPPGLRGQAGGSSNCV